MGVTISPVAAMTSRGDRKDVAAMGLRWSTPRVLGFSVSARVGSPHPRGCGAVPGVFLVFFAVFEAIYLLVHVWWLALPALALFCLWMGHRTDRRAKNVRPMSQASVSNRR